MGWMNDFLKYMSLDTLERKYHQNLLTFSTMFAWSEHFVLVLSHDEMVHGKKSLIGKMPGDYMQQFSGLRAAYGYFFAHPGKKLLFMGGEFGQYIEWRYKYGLDWMLRDFELHRKMRQCVKDLNCLYADEKALHEMDDYNAGFEWVDCNDTDHSILSFLRKGRDWRDMLMIVCNFSTASFDGYRIGAPLDTTYSEVLNTDDVKYGGGGTCNGTIAADPIPWQRKPYSIVLKLPPLSVIFLRPDTARFRKQGPSIV
jgi:1,4-alpha-glucan branching enzyme